MIKFFNLTVLLVKVKAHNNCEYNNVVDKLAKNTLSKDPIFIDLRLLMYRGFSVYIEMSIGIIQKHSQRLNGQVSLEFLKAMLSFKVKIRTEELPMLDNLVKRKPYVYNSKWKCPICFKDKKTYSHLWKCEHLEQVYIDMIDKFQ